MSGIPLGLIIEISVAILLMMTIGYCFVLNNRLKKLHADKNALREMVADLVQATNLANNAIVSLKDNATEADIMLSSRLEDADRFANELAHHVNAGQTVLQRISQITQAASQKNTSNGQVQNRSANEALKRLREYQLRKEEAAA